MAIRQRKLAGGKVSYEVTVKHDGKRDYDTAYSLAEARALEVAMKARYGQSDAHRAPITLQEYIYQVYWPIASKRLSATSKDTYEKELRLRVVPSLGKARLREIDRQAIQSMIDGCATACVAKKALGVLKTVLNEAMHDGYIQRNCACAKYAMPSEGRRRDNRLVLGSFEEIHAFLDCVDSSGSECVRRIAYTGLLQGLRPEERYALEWDSFDLEAGTLTVDKARIAATPKHGGVSDKETKTAMSTRVIPLHPRLRALVESATRDGAFIAGLDGGKISPSTAQKRWRAFLRDNPDCPPVTIENMRHSFATAYLAAGGQIEVLSRLLGHSNISTTINRYYRPGIGTLQSDAQAVWASGRLA